MFVQMTLSINSWNDISRRCARPIRKLVCLWCGLVCTPRSSSTMGKRSVAATIRRSRDLSRSTVLTTTWFWTIRAPLYLRCVRHHFCNSFVRFYGNNSRSVHTAHNTIAKRIWLVRRAYDRRNYRTLRCRIPSVIEFPDLWSFATNDISLRKQKFNMIKDSEITLIKWTKKKEPTKIHGLTKKLKRNNRGPFKNRHTDTDVLMQIAKCGLLSQTL